MRDALQHVIHSEFGHIPIVQETEWATPGWTMILREGGEIATFYNIVEREVLLDNIPTPIAGINNVITPQAYRGKGYATQLLRETESFIFEELRCEFGLLLCADELIPFYERLGWYSVDCPVYFRQSHGEKLWAANAMLLASDKEVKPNAIHLNGLPW